MTGGLFQSEALNAGLFLPLLQFALPMLILEWLYASATLPAKAAPFIRTTVYALAFYLFVFHGEVSESFIYFQF